MQDLLGAGADVDAQANDGDTPLDIAASRACPPAFHAVLARGGRASKGALCFSDRFLLAPGGTDAAIDFIEANEPFTFERTQSYNSVRDRAFQRGSLKAIPRLFKLEGDPNLGDDQGHTPFHYSAELCRHQAGIHALFALVTEGGLINATNKDGKSALQLAVAKSSHIAVQFLLGQGADLHDGGTLSAVSPQFAVTMLEHPDGIAMMLKLVRAGMTVDNAPRYRMQARSRPRCFRLVREVREISAMDPPSVRSACVAFLSTFYPLLEGYSSDSPLHEWEIELTKTETSEQGGFSDCRAGVFLGRHKVAMKALRTHVIGDEVAAKRMKREMSVWKKLHHPNVLPFVGWCILESKSYMVSPWMENGNALAYVKQRTQANRLQLLVQVAEGMLYLHTRPKNPVIHGDLKAANVLISSAGVARIADFGLSELVEDEKAPRCSTAWYCGGNPRWQAPELLSAGTKEEARRTKETDCFAYGRVMLEIFTGQVPFFYLSVNTTLSVFNMVLDGRLPDRPLDKDIVAKGLDDSMWEFMKMCWSMDPKERPSAAKIFSHLKAALRGRPDDDSDSEGSGSARPGKRARVTEQPVKQLPGSSSKRIKTEIDEVEVQRQAEVTEAHQSAESVVAFYEAGQATSSTSSPPFGQAVLNIPEHCDPLGFDLAPEAASPSGFLSPEEFEAWFMTSFH
ncbi:hypothetical protein BOTBODRAFT_526202 [Botryobasidium botryosum FD-172 SS1]|uniref:Protein kinase domain-containing protein n=1 Tax=Botryobasidium botryosum (strain FD-172 SS1) TaxID=930990 RepID=A0A067M0Z4_BOTB1|nr:hypothetical protein BOTBODRAFT_526202 [Botryobasidium botryosum FD-172 SS1]